MKKFLTLFMSVILTISMLGVTSVSGQALPNIPDFYTYDELQDMDEDVLQSIYDGYIGSPAVCFYEKNCTEEQQIEDCCKEIYGDCFEYPYPFEGLPRYLVYNVDTMYEPEESATADIFGLPADWTVTVNKGEVKDMGFNYGKSYVQGNSYRVDVPDDVFKSHWKFVRLWFQQKMFERSLKASELHIDNTKFVLSENIGMPAPMQMGDADGRYDGVTINDAVNIMSYCGNPSKYPLDVYCKRAADVYNNGDGVNNMDALAVQRYAAGIITELPYSYNEQRPENKSGTFKVKVKDQNGEPVEGVEIEIRASLVSNVSPVPSIAIAPEYVTTDKNGEAEIGLLKGQSPDKGIGREYTAVFAKIPEGYHYLPDYKDIEFDFFDEGKDVFSAEMTFINTKAENYDCKDYDLVVDYITAPYPKVYSQYDPVIKTGSIRLKVRRVYKDGSYTILYDNEKFDDIENISIGEIDTSLTGIQDIPVVIKDYNADLNKWVEAETSVTIEFLHVYTTATTTRRGRQTTTTTTTTETCKECTTTSTMLMGSIFDTEIIDTIEYIDNKEISFENTTFGTALRFGEGIAGYFRSYNVGDTIKLNCALTEGGYIITDIAELRPVYYENEDQGKTLQLRITCFDSDYSHEKSGAKIRITSWLNSTEDVIHPEDKEMFFTVSEGETLIKGLSNNDVIYEAEIMDFEKHYINTESDVLTIDDKTIRKCFYLRYLTEDDKKNLEEIPFSFTSNIADITDNTVTFANGEVLENASRYFSDFDKTKDLHVEGVRKEGYGNKLHRLDQAAIVNGAEKAAVNFTLDCNSNHEDDILLEIHGRHIQPMCDYNGAEPEPYKIYGYVRVKTGEVSTMELAKEYEYKLHIKDDYSWHNLNSEEFSIYLDDKDVNVSVNYCPPPLTDDQDGASLGAALKNDLLSLGEASFSGNQALVTHPLTVSKSGCCIAFSTVEWSVSGTAEVEIETNSMLDTTTSYDDCRGVSGCLLTAKTPGTVVLTALEKSDLGSIEFKYILQVDENLNFDGTLETLAVE